MMEPSLFVEILGLYVQTECSVAKGVFSCSIIKTVAELMQGVISFWKSGVYIHLISSLCNIY